jgi:hypothetical protein
MTRSGLRTISWMVGTSAFAIIAATIPAAANAQTSVEAQTGVEAQPVPSVEPAPA